jgi:SRSO17 transposase
VTDREDDAVAVPPGLDLAAWRAGFDEVFARVAGRFAQACSRKRARAYLLGLLSRTERKNGWTIAEFAGDATPDGMQRLLNFCSWSADDVRDDLRDYAAAEIGNAGGVLVPDETGFLKKGSKSAGGSGSTPAPRAGSRTASWECSWRMRYRAPAGR